MDALPFDKFREECGVFGIWGDPEASNLTYLGLYALQHRGQESAGIVASDGARLFIHKDMGLVNDIFDEARLKQLPGTQAIGHVRYSTTGSSELKNAQPFVVECARGTLAIAHNGNLVNADELRRKLEAEGAIFQSTMDSEIFVHLMARSRADSLEEAIIESLAQVKGAYALLIMNEDVLYAMRDPCGLRPLSLGMREEAYVVASETCAFDLIGARHIRDIEPGEMIRIGRDGLTTRRLAPHGRVSQCIFEHIYFSRPDSVVFGRNVHEARRAMGRRLAIESGVPADLVVPVPDSGVPAALGYAEQAGIPFEMGMIRNHYVGRTFIEPQQSIRHFGVKIKLNPIRPVIAGKRIVVVDDSIVRGTTSRKIIKMFREGGAKEVHFRIASPPTIFPCFYGIDTPNRKELIAVTHSLEEIRRHLTADSLAYLSREGMLGVMGEGPAQEKFCTACFNGDYPIDFAYDQIDQLKLFDGREARVVYR